MKNRKKPETQEEVWDAIADTWASYKEKPIPLVQEYLEDKQGIILDLGVGSGRNITPKENTTYYGVDFSEEQLRNAEHKAKKERITLKTFHTPATKLPFPDNTFDTAICISVIHCIKGKKERQQAIKELYRVMKPQTTAMISVWYQPGRKTKEEYRGFKIGQTSHKRYYYYYDKEEFLEELQQTGFTIIKHYANDFKDEDHFIKRNINVIITKPS